MSFDQRPTRIHAAVAHLPEYLFGKIAVLQSVDQHLTSHLSFAVEVQTGRKLRFLPASRLGK